MYLEDKSFDVEFSCRLCGSNKVELEYDQYNNRIIVTCECGNKDIIYFD